MNEKQIERFDGAAATPRSLTDNGSATCKIVSRELFKGHREVLIEHGTRVYRLRITTSGKLILTA